MKLLSKTTKTYVLFTTPIVLICIVLFFFLIRSFNIKHVENALIKEQKKIAYKSQGIQDYFIEDELSLNLILVKIPNDSIVIENFSTVMVYDSIEKKNEPHRQLEMMQGIAGDNYKIIIRKSLVENITLYYSIGIAMTALLAIISLTFIFLNRKLSQKIWQPFYSTLTDLEDYHVGQSTSLDTKLEIDEFRRLNIVSNNLTERINKEFFVQKEFIDIVSHEYQTPLTVIGNEAENLIQNIHLKESELEKLGRIIEYVQRLSKMNKSLLYLSRIDNKQFIETKKIDVRRTIERLLEEKQDIINMKDLIVHKTYTSESLLNMNLMLSNVLFGNLLQNAIRHNIPKGIITIELNTHEVKISNTSYNDVLNPNLIFKKFNKKSASQNSIGLGTSLIKSICRYYNFKLIYTYSDEHKVHQFTIKF